MLEFLLAADAVIVVVGRSPLHPRPLHGPDEGERPGGGGPGHPVAALAERVQHVHRGRLDADVVVDELERGEHF